MTKWEYARLEYKMTGGYGTDQFLDWHATFHHPAGTLNWGTDEHFDDLRHLNQAGAAGWQAYARGVVTMAGEPHRLYSVSYSLRRPAAQG